MPESLMNMWFHLAVVREQTTADAGNSKQLCSSFRYAAEAAMQLKQLCSSLRSLLRMQLLQVLNTLLVSSYAAPSGPQYATSLCAP